MRMAVGLSGAPTAFPAGWLGIRTMLLSCAFIHGCVLPLWQHHPALERDS